jgi:hypothetical protein
MLRRSEIPPPVLLKYAGVKRWSEFERGMTFWTIEEKDGSFEIAGQKKCPDAGWRDDPNLTIAFPPGTSTDEVIDRMVAILQNAVASTG